MILFYFTICGIDLERGKVNKENGNYEFIVFQFLFFTIMFTNEKLSGAIITAAKGLTENREWLIEHAAAIRLATKRQRAKLITAREKDLENEVKYYSGQCNKLSNENSKCRNDLRFALKAIELKKEETT